MGRTKAQSKPKEGGRGHGIKKAKKVIQESSTVKSKKGLVTMLMKAKAKPEATLLTNGPLAVGDPVEVKESGVVHECRVVQVAEDLVQVHYQGWNARYDTWVRYPGSSRQALRDRTNKALEEIVPNLALKSKTKLIEASPKTMEMKDVEVKPEIKVKEEKKYVNTNPGLSEYELIRLENIRQREALFAELNLDAAKVEASPRIERTVSAPSRRGLQSEKKEKEVLPRRASTRLTGGSVTEIERWQSLDSDMINDEAGHAVELDKCDDLPCVTSVENEENSGSSSGSESREGREVLIEERLCQWWTGAGKRTGQFLVARGKRPAARCLAGEHGESSINKVLKTEHFRGRENDKKVKLTEASVREENKKDGEKTEPEKEPEQRVENSINVEEEKSMELDLPVKSSKKNKKFVPESDSDEKTTKVNDILGKKKRNSSAKKKPSPPVKDISFKVNEVETSMDQEGIVHAAAQPDLVQEERRTDSDEVMNEVCSTRMFQGQEYDFRCIYCKVLPRKGMASRSELYRHYASHHFSEELKREFGNVTVCPVCGIEMKSCWRHNAEVHDEVEKYLPERAKIPKAITYRRPRKRERTRMKGKLAHNSDSTACRFPAIPEGYYSERGINLNEDGEANSNGPLVVDGFIIEEQVVEEAEEEEQSYLLSQDEKLECAVCGEMFSRGHFKPASRHWKEQHGLRKQGPYLNLDLLSLISAGYLK